MPQIALTLLDQFKAVHPDNRIRCIFADALYGTAQFLDHASDIFGRVQVISQIRFNQIVRYRGKDWSVEKYFAVYSGVEQNIEIRGGEEVKIIVGSARLYLHAHGKKRFVIALKYEGEDKYRYIETFEQLLF